ncbi:hypothetical protein BpHYR1_041943 [Brachionus plicatilis]|uniref:Uncharacterized protein n=1 Tax=Brachionus plicatilis TaxID=10195 RepID=A0A3M7QEP0_BRAPC|nr:hypothetical protein BpHYR1_041943 [Brachionus plicatilis]
MSNGSHDTKESTRKNKFFPKQLLDMSCQWKNKSDTSKIDHKLQVAYQNHSQILQLKRMVFELTHIIHLFCIKIMQCEYCNEKEDDKGLFSLPCGYLVCSHHIKSAEDYFNCFVCDEHMINRQSCLQMPRNRKKMEKISFIEKKKDILNICDQIEQFKLDPKSFLEKASDDIINKIDLKREVLKTNLNKQVDNYYESLLNEVKEKQLNIIDSVKVDFEGINTQEIREKLNLDSDVNSTDYQVQIESLVNLRSSYLDEHLKIFQSFMNTEFFEGEEEPQVKMSKFFGTIDLRDSNETFGGKTGKSAYSKTLSNEFKLIAKVGLEKILELSSDNDEIIAIDSEFHAKIWYNLKFLNTFDIVRKDYRCVELFSTNHKFESFMKEGLSYVGFSIYNIQTGKLEKYKEIRENSIGNISTIEKINKDECHDSKISTFVPCENGLIVSICVNGEIKIWDQNNLRFIKETTAINPTYARILKSELII